MAASLWLPVQSWSLRGGRAVCLWDPRWLVRAPLPSRTSCFPRLRMSLSSSIHPRSTNGRIHSGNQVSESASRRELRAACRPWNGSTSPRALGVGSAGGPSGRDGWEQSPISVGHPGGELFFAIKPRSVGPMICWKGVPNGKRRFPELLPQPHSCSRSSRALGCGGVCIYILPS